MAVNFQARGYRDALDGLSEADLAIRLLDAWSELAECLGLRSDGSAEAVTEAQLLSCSTTGPACEFYPQVEFIRATSVAFAHGDEVDLLRGRQAIAAADLLLGTGVLVQSDVGHMGDGHRQPPSTHGGDAAAFNRH